MPKKDESEETEPKKPAEEPENTQESEKKDLKEKTVKQKISDSRMRRVLKDRELSFKTFLLSHLGILLIGLLFLGGIYYILYFDRNPLNLATYNPVTKEPISFDLEVNSPEDNSLVFDESIVVSGKTDPKSTVLISNNGKDTGFEADSNGGFTKVISLSPGVNYITISAFDPEGSIKNQKLTVYYSKDKLEEEKE